MILGQLKLGERQAKCRALHLINSLFRYGQHLQPHCDICLSLGRFQRKGAFQLLLNHIDQLFLNQIEQLFLNNIGQLFLNHINQLFLLKVKIRITLTNFF